MSAPHVNPTLFFQDTFTEASDTTLASHTPDQGNGWTRVWGTDGSSTLQVVGANDNLAPGATQSNSGVIYSADGVYPSADYEVSAVIGSGFTGTNRVYLIVRMTDQENMYALRLTTGATVTRMYKKVSGSWSALGSFKADPSPGDKVSIRVVGSTLSYYYNDVLIDTQTDTAISGTGKAGIAVGGGAELAASGDDITTSASLDSFTVGLPSFAYTQFASSVTSMPVNLPSTQLGDLLVAAVHVRNSGSWTPPSDWTEFGSQTGGSSVGELTLFYKIATGGEGGQATWTASTGTTAVWQVFRIKNWHGSSAPEVQTVSGDATAADPPSISPSWGAAESLILTLAGHSAASTAAWSAGPSGYSTQRQHGASSGGAAVCISSAYKEITASSEDPGAYTVSGSNRWWSAATIAIRPASSPLPSEIEHTTDSLLYLQLSIEHTTDSLIKRTQTIEHTTDSYLLGFEVKQHSTDSLLRATLTTNHSTDSLLFEVFEVAHTTDSLLYIQETVEHTTDSTIRRTQTKTHSTDSLLQIIVELVQVTDSLLRKTTEKAHTTDSLLITRSSKTHTTDSLLLRVTRLEHSTDSTLDGTAEVSHTTDSYISTSQSIEHTTDSTLRRTQYRDHSTDALVQKAAVLYHSTDSLLRASLIRTHTTDSYMRSFKVISHTTDSTLDGTAEVAHTTDSFISTSTRITHTTDSTLRKEMSVSHTTDFLAYLRRYKAHISDSFLYIVSEVIHATDSLLRRTQSRQHATDSLLYIVREQSHSTDSLILKVIKPDEVHSVKAKIVNKGIRFKIISQIMQMRIVNVSDYVTFKEHKIRVRIINKGIKVKIKKF